MSSALLASGEHHLVEENKFGFLNSETVNTMKISSVVLLVVNNLLQL